MVDGLYLLPHLRSGTVVCEASLVAAGQARSVKIALPHAVAAGDDVPVIDLLVLRLDDGALRVYLNRCAHFGLPLNARDGYEFLNDEGDQVVLRCQHHYMDFCPATGEGLSFECRGDALTDIPVAERDGQIVTL
ncbi:Rieske (2Fe-2S) protein [Insolitispirillum peregrinum]|uniref:Ferredoxin subunit of nitrite reductase or a ring-hydroxylating dioxygenase n=1 Tax=Insolitispirillum peregrinum TaxID=80876 RepID=A0A1N7LMN7_9PROT|nr:Rieske 2Fe-2S domain-containing protein [Insolitispirillum peregrinum]SIS75090.1 Ferredoxin subunit of nitrite reductase or a ring-hydroxylating dioxygenase [Insolitispirillum peregrinum]